MRRSIAVGILLVAGAFLTGCDLLDIINDLIPGGGGTGAAAFTRIIVEYDIAMDVMRRDTGVQLQSVVASIGSIGTIAYDGVNHTYTAQNPFGSDPYVLITINMDPSETTILYIDAYRRMSHGFDTWERIDRIIAENVYFDRTDPNGSTFFRIDASDVMWSGLQTVDYRDWSKALHTEADPMYWVVNPLAAQGFFDADPDRYIEIEFRP